jgi:hypothetical protein
MRRSAPGRMLAATRRIEMVQTHTTRADRIRRQHFMQSIDRDGPIACARSIRRRERAHRAIRAERRAR